jgi:tetratricopeptide (TPR) repeat protein
MKTRSLGVGMLLALLSMFAWAAGGGGGGAGGGGGDAERSAKLDPDWSEGVAAVKNQDWPVVVTRMSAVVQRDSRNADALNYLGYAYRHLGDMGNSFKYYEKALLIDPRHLGAHEYMGEAYLQVGQLAKAEEHLKALARLCRQPCEEYVDLKEKIAQYRRERPQ